MELQLLRGTYDSVECPAALPNLLLDTQKMHGVFANLLDNALKHTRAGGEVRIAVSAPGDHLTAAYPSAVQIDISDTGAGIGA